MCTTASHFRKPQAFRLFSYTPVSCRFLFISGMKIHLKEHKNKRLVTNHSGCFITVGFCLTDVFIFVFKVASKEHLEYSSRQPNKDTPLTLNAFSLEMPWIHLQTFLSSVKWSSCCWTSERCGRPRRAGWPLTWRPPVTSGWLTPSRTSACTWSWRTATVSHYHACSGMGRDS